jgi:hypothetical protein
MATLIEVRGRDVECHEPATLTRATKLIRGGRYLMAGGIGGSLSIQPALGGGWLCRFKRAGELLSREEFGRKLAVYDWLREWFPRLLGKPGQGLHRARNPGRPGQDLAVRFVRRGRKAAR